MAIDSGDGGHSDLVHSFCRPRFGKRVFAIKGVAGFSRPFIERSSAKNAPLFLVGTDAVKSQLFTRLTRSGSIRFSCDLHPVYFEQLVSERRVLRYVKGAPQRRFERISGKRAECLDATVYALAVRNLVNADMDRREAELATPAAAKPQVPSVIRSSWLNR